MNATRLTVTAMLGLALTLLLAGQAVATPEDPSPDAAAPAMIAQADRDADDRPKKVDDDDDRWRERGEYDRDRRDGDDRRGRFGHKELDDEQVGQALSVLQDVNPEFAQRIKAGLEGENPERAKRGLERMWPWLEDMHDLKRNDRALYDLRLADNKAKAATFRLARAIHQARRDNDTQQLEQLRTKLRRQLEAHFEVRQKLRENELAKLERRIETMREELAEHRASKDELIAASMKRILEGRRGPRGDRNDKDDDDRKRDDDDQARPNAETDRDE